jgi:hypothetical protein
MTGKYWLTPRIERNTYAFAGNEFVQSDCMSDARLHFETTVQQHAPTFRRGLNQSPHFKPLTCKSQCKPPAAERPRSPPEAANAPMVRYSALFGVPSDAMAAIADKLDPRMHNAPHRDPFQSDGLDEAHLHSQELCGFVF